jgi:hypothetical protein
VRVLGLHEVGDGLKIFEVAFELGIGLGFLAL